MRALQDFLWVFHRIFLEGVVCVSVFYWFVLRWSYQSTDQGMTGFLKAVFFFTADKTVWVAGCFYAVWAFHWFYFWIRMRDHIYKKSAEKVFWASVVGVGVVGLLCISRRSIGHPTYQWFLLRVFWPSLKFFVCGSFPVLLMSNLYLWLTHYQTKAPWADPPFPWYREKSKLSVLLKKFSFEAMRPPKESPPVVCSCKSKVQNEVPLKVEPVPPKPIEEKVLL